MFETKHLHVGALGDIIATHIKQFQSFMTFHSLAKINNIPVYQSLCKYAEEHLVLLEVSEGRTMKGSAELMSWSIER